MKKISQLKNNIISLSNKTIPVQFDRIVILTSSGKYEKALEEISFIKSQLNLLESQLKEINSIDKE
jgi:hypothetical protein